MSKSLAEHVLFTFDTDVMRKSVATDICENKRMVNNVTYFFFKDGSQLRLSENGEWRILINGGK